MKKHDSFLPLRPLHNLHTCIAAFGGGGRRHAQFMSAQKVREREGRGHQLPPLLEAQVVVAGGAGRRRRGRAGRRRWVVGASDAQSHPRAEPRWDRLDRGGRNDLYRLTRSAWSENGLPGPTPCLLPCASERAPLDSALSLQPSRRPVNVRQPFHNRRAPRIGPI